MKDRTPLILGLVAVILIAAFGAVLVYRKNQQEDKFHLRIDQNGIIIQNGSK
jgi:uncharacterized protein HemX